MSGPKRYGKCLHCQREGKKIIGRGLCGSCYWGIHNGKIDPALYPPLIMPQRANKRRQRKLNRIDSGMEKQRLRLHHLLKLLLECIDAAIINIRSHEDVEEIINRKMAAHLKELRLLVAEIQGTEKNNII